MARRSEGPIEDIDIVRSVLNGDTEAYAGLVRAHQGAVLRLCVSLLADAVQAEDAAQEVFVKAYRSLPKFRGGSAFSTWLYRIASNHCLDLLRKRSRQKTESWDALLEKEGEKAQALFAAGSVTGSSDQAELINRILACLSPDYRTILILREVQGLPYEAIAAVLGLSLDSVKARLRRARQALQAKARHFMTPADV